MNWLAYSGYTRNTALSAHWFYPFKVYFSLLIPGVEGAAWFLFVAYRKKWEEKDQAKTRLAKRNQDWSYRKFPAYPDWKDNKIRKFTVRKVCSGRKPRMWLNHFLLVLLKDQNGQNIQSTRGCFKEMRIVIQGSPQSSQ